MENEKTYIMVGVLMQKEMREILKRLVRLTGEESSSFLIRKMILAKAKEFGLDTSFVENQRRGVRKDIASGSEEALKQVRSAGIKGRASQARKRAAKLDALRKEKQSELES